MLQLQLAPRPGHDVGLLIFCCESGLPPSSFIAEALSVAVLDSNGSPRFSTIILAVSGCGVEEESAERKAGDARGCPAPTTSGLVFLRTDGEKAVDEALVELALTPEHECDFLLQSALGLVALPCSLQSSSDTAVSRRSYAGIFDGEELQSLCQSLIESYDDENAEQSAPNSSE